MAKSNLQFSYDEIKTEQWKPVAAPGYEHAYEVSTLGRVRRLMTDSQNKAKKGDFINPSYPGLGIYQQYALCVNRRYSRWLAHRLVLMTFVGEPPTPDHQAAHINGNPKDNRLENLCWKTAKENDLDKDQHGTRQRGIKHGCHKLTDEQVIDIRRKRSEGVSGIDIADKYGITPQNVSKIVCGKNWTHLPMFPYKRNSLAMRIDSDLFDRAIALAKSGASALEIVRETGASLYCAQKARERVQT